MSIMVRKRIFLTTDANKAYIAFENPITIKHSILREPSLVDEFYFESTDASNDSIPSVSFVDPVYMLFNQERLSNLGTVGIEKFLESFSQKEDSLRELRSKCSDEDLARLIKSKYLQSASEVTAWCRYMQSNIDEFNTEVRKLLESKQADNSADKLYDSVDKTSVESKTS